MAQIRRVCDLGYDVVASRRTRLRPTRLRSRRPTTPRPRSAPAATTATRRFGWDSRRYNPTTTRRPLTLILWDQGTTRSLLADSVPPAKSGRGDGPGGPPKYVILQNEANFSGCWRIWSGLRDKVLATQVCHFVTWLRFAKTKPKLGSFYQNWLLLAAFSSRLHWLRRPHKLGASRRTRLSGLETTRGHLGVTLTPRFGGPDTKRGFGMT
jgi:hypothetical protein